MQVVVQSTLRAHPMRSLGAACRSARSRVGVRGWLGMLMSVRVSVSVGVRVMVRASLRARMSVSVSVSVRARVTVASSFIRSVRVGVSVSVSFKASVRVRGILILGVDIGFLITDDGGDGGRRPLSLVAALTPSVTIVKMKMEIARRGEGE